MRWPEVTRNTSPADARTGQAPGCVASGEALQPRGRTKGFMGEKFDLEKMLLEIRDDEAIDTAKAKHLSQLQIQDLVTRRRAPAPKPATKATDAH